MITFSLQAKENYILAVSGGVDSVVLLDLLAAKYSSQLIVAHIDHGWRKNSGEDAAFVRSLADKYGCRFELSVLEKSESVSESQARRSRYDFLDQLKNKYEAKAVITAHHQDDLLETMIINFTRGSHRRGYTSLQSRHDLLRPMLQLSKQQILDYAQLKNLAWREDATNLDLSRLRNSIRNKIMPKLSSIDRQRLIEINRELTIINNQLDESLSDYLRYKSFRRQESVFSLSWFRALPQALANEIVASWLKKHQVPSYDRKQIDYIVEKLQSLPAGKRIVISGHQEIILTKRCLRLML